MTDLVIYTPGAGADPASFADMAQARIMALDGPSDADAVRAVQNVLSQDRNVRAIMLVRSAPEAVAARLGAGACAGDALAAWRREAARELAVFRANRACILMLDWDDLQRAPQGGADVAHAWFRRGDVPEPPGPPGLANRAEGEPACLIAQMLCASDPDVRMLMQEHGASCAWIHRSPPGEALRDACAAAERLSQWLDERGTGVREAWQVGLEAAQDNLRFMLAENGALQDAHGALAGSNKALEARVASLDSELDAARGMSIDLRSMLHACEAQLATHQTRSAVMADTLDQVQAEILAVWREVDQMRRRAEDAEHHCVGPERERAQLLSSEAWQVTGPFRWVINTLRGNR